MAALQARQRRLFDAAGGHETVKSLSCPRTGPPGANWIVQAIVGCDGALRTDGARLLVRHIREPGALQEVRLACAGLGPAVSLADRAWAEPAADALLITLREPLVERTDVRLAQDDYPALAAALVAACERLPPTPAADHAARALDIFLP